MTTPITKKQLQLIIESADDVLSAKAGTNEDVHPESDEMIRLWDYLNDVAAPPEIVKRLTEIALAVLPEEMNFSAACNFVQINGMAKEDRVTLAMRAWNACRAAMLNHSEHERGMVEPVSQPYKLPERVTNALTLSLQAMEFMGDTLNNLDAVCTEDVEFIAPAFEAVRAALAGNSPVIPEGWVACSERMPDTDGNYWGWWSKSKRQGPVWFIKSDIQAQFQSSEITHWMPLPAAPQQEGKQISDL